MTQLLIGFAIALAVGLTGVGGGSFTVPALLLFAGLSAGEAVGTAFVFAGIVRLVAAPFYLFHRQIHSRYFWLLLRGAVPGLLAGTLVLRQMTSAHNGNSTVVIILGAVLALSSAMTFVPRARDSQFAVKNSRWLPWLAFPIGVESGFSSAGAGALGTVLLLNYSEMTPAQVVGTDLLFGLVLAVIGGMIHWTVGSISLAVLFQLVLGGLPGVLVGCLLSRYIPARRLRAVIAVLAICAGLQLVVSGVKARFSKPAESSSRSASGNRLLTSASLPPRLEKQQ
ncbi:MAG TPA: sulfite exporter TauE/SafE family protein [Candidatus Acidoferrum sp.]|nr:sulfite exporter TauE/SafE family protein [Candidatus Acidoferrum sp.]